MMKPNSAEFGYFYTDCPIIWTLFQFLFTINKNYDTLTSERDIANGAIPFLATGTCSNNRNMHRSRCNYGGENMALFDWNGNGKRDIFDTAIEFEIFKNIFGNDDEKDETDDFGFDDADDDF